VMLYFLPLETVPEVVSFKANADAHPQAAINPTLQPPALGQPQPNPGVASFRR